MKNNIVKAFTLTCFVTVFSCSVIDDQQPQNSLPASEAVTDPASARASLNGAYDITQSGNYMGLRYLLFPDLHATGGSSVNNLRHSGTFPSFAQFANKAILANNVEVTNMWTTIYNGINRANLILDKVPGITDPAFTDKNGVLGEAYFLRAFHLFNALRYWGRVPIVTKPTEVVDGNLQVGRSSIADVYTQIFSDIAQAETLAPTSQSTKGRVTKAVVAALKARVHLQRSSTGIAVEWAEVIANADIAASGRTLVTPFSAIFEVKNTNEAIWEIPFDPVDNNTIAFFLLPTANGGRNEMRPTANLQNAFLSTDVRRISTGATNVSLKYYRVATGDDHVVVFRLAEMLLSKAEALVERNGAGDLTAATGIVNQIRTRAGIGNYAGAVDQVSLRNEVFTQRRLELALEGHYFFDVVRTGRAPVIFAPWNDNQALLPIPEREINANAKLQGDQNPGY